MTVFLIERALTCEPIAIVEAEHEVQAFERLVSVVDVLGLTLARLEHLNIVQHHCSGGEREVPSFSDGYFKLRGPNTAYLIQ